MLRIKFKYVQILRQLQIAVLCIQREIYENGINMPFPFLKINIPYLKLTNILSHIK